MMSSIKLFKPAIVEKPEDPVKVARNAKVVEIPAIQEIQQVTEKIVTDDKIIPKVTASQPFKMVDREKAQSLINFDYPKDWNNYNNCLVRYRPKLK